MKKISSNKKNKPKKIVKNELEKTESEVVLEEKESLFEKLKLQANKNITTLVILIVISLAIFLLVWFLNYQNRSLTEYYSIKNNSKKTIIEKIFPKKEVVFPTNKPVTIKPESQKEIEWLEALTVHENKKQEFTLLTGDIDYFKEISEISKNISKIKYLDTRKMVVFLASDDASNKKTISTHDLALNETKEVFSFQTTEGRGKLLSDRLSDFNIYDQENKIIITTSNQVWSYEISTQKLEQFYSDEELGYSIFVDPLVSPDGKKISLILGYYEGNGAALLDIENKKLEKIDFGGYIEGDRVLDWEGDKFVTFSYAFENEENKVCLTDYLKTDSSCSSNLGDISFYASKLKGDDVIVGVATSRAKRKYFIYKVNLTSMESTKLLEIDDSYLNTLETRFEIMDINGQERIVALIRDGVDKKMVVVSEDGANRLHELNFSQ